MELFTSSSSPDALTRLAVGNYRSLLSFVTPLRDLNVVTGSNASGKSNLYRGLRLLAETARGGVARALALEGGLQSAFWAGPETITREMRAGVTPVQGGPRKKRKRLRLGFAGSHLGFAISFGLPKPDDASAFALDPEIKQETAWIGPSFRPAAVLLERKSHSARLRTESGWLTLRDDLPLGESIFDHLASSRELPEILLLRETIRGWRFYDQFRTDPESPARQVQIGCRTPVLGNDGADLAAAMQTIMEEGRGEVLERLIHQAFPGAGLRVIRHESSHFQLNLEQPGLLRPLSAAELSDGTLRFLLWCAALLSPRPAPLMVLNEPENSLHPVLIPVLAELISEAAVSSQVCVVTHSEALIRELSLRPATQSIPLRRVLGQTELDFQGDNLLDRPSWRWPDNV